MIKDVMLKEEILTSILQLLLALALGFAIGFERKMRYKEAGIRTHTIVCVGACLYMIISKFITKGSSADPGRIAAQIVSGIGFIGHQFSLPGSHIGGQIDPRFDIPQQKRSTKLGIRIYTIFSQHRFPDAQL